MRARPFEPVRTAARLDFPGMVEDRCHRVTTARVVVADYALLQRDFPHLSDERLSERFPELLAKSESGRRRAIRGLLDHWLLEHAALMATTQATGNRANGPVAVEPEEVPVLRPPRYRRAGIVSLPESWRSLPPSRRSRWPREPAGLLDLKGIGVLPDVVPTRFSDTFSAHGLCSTGRALSEFAWQRMLSAVFDHANAPFAVLPIYAVIDLGVNDYKGRPVGVQVRRAHRRYPHDFFHPIGSPAYRGAVIVELLLRRYGITTTAPGSTIDVSLRNGRARYALMGEGFPCDADQVRAYLDVVAPGSSRVVAEYINVQATRPADPRTLALQMYDLEAIVARRSFDAPLVMAVGNRAFRWGGVLAPSDPAWVQPDPRYAVPIRDWGAARLARGRTRTDEPVPIPTQRGMRLAKALRAGRIDRTDVERDIAERVARATERWPSTSSALADAHRAADALFAVAATTGTRLLTAERSVRSSRKLDAAECLIALQDLDRLPRSEGRDVDVAMALRHRAHWALRRLLASEEVRAVVRSLERKLAASRLEARRAPLARTLDALEALRRPEALPWSELRAKAAILHAEPSFARCLSRWSRRLGVG